MSKKNKKETYEYRATIRLVCCDDGETKDTRTRIYTSTEELDLDSDITQEYFLNELYPLLDYEPYNGDFIVIEIIDRKNNDLTIYTWVKD